MSGATVNSAGLVSCEITKPRLGVWHADIEVDSETAVARAVTMTIDGVVFVGTVVPGRSGVFAKMATAKIVGGKGGLSKSLDAKQYSGGSVTVGSVVRDILRLVGETLSATADAATLGRALPSWERAQGQSSHALTNVLDAVQAAWRVLNDGTVWVGPETWPAVTFEHVVEDEDWGKGVIQIASDAPLLEPGTLLEGQPLELVRHTVCDAVLRSFGYLHSPASSLSKFLRGVRRQIDYSRTYPCRVATQHADGSLQLVPDDAKMKGQGLDKVKPRHGLPGFVVKVLPGARVMLGFDAGDPSRPYASLWDQDGEPSVTSVEYKPGGSGAGAATIGSSVLIFLDPGTPLPIVGGLIVAGVVTPFAPGTFITIATALHGVIETGNPKLLF